MTRGLIRRDPGELPAEVTGFVGRQRELAVLDGLLGTARLVTVTGRRREDARRAAGCG